MNTVKKILLMFTLLSLLVLVAGCGDNNKISISEEEFNMEVERTMAGMTRQGYEIGDLEDFKQDVIRQMVESEILTRLIKAEKFKLEKGYLDNEIESIQESFGSEEDFLAALETDGFTLKTFRKEYGNTLLQKRYYEDVLTPSIEIIDDDIKAFYTENPQYFMAQESVSASHILVLAGDAASEAEKKEARKKIEDILVKVKRGDDFAELAKEYSDCSSAAYGGSLGEFGRNQMVPEFEEAAFALEPGEISGIVETMYGYHIIRLDGKIPAGVSPLDESVSAEIKEYLQYSEAQEKMNEMIRNARENYKLDVPVEVSWE